MITIKYTILLSNPRQTFITRYSIVPYRVGNFCKIINLDENGYEEEGNVYKFMDLSVNGKSVRLHSITNPITQYKRFGIM